MPVSIRAAHSDDATRVSELCRRATPVDLRPATPIGSCCAGAWIRHRIALSDDVESARDSQTETNGVGALEQAPAYRIADDDRRIVGVAEWRMIDARLFLNTIASAPRGRGIGTLLLREGLERWPSPELVELDVFASMPNAIRWYNKLGFEAVRESEWVFYPPLVPEEKRRATIQKKTVSRNTHAERVQWMNQGRATTNHDSYGVSMLDLKTEGNNHRVGRLGTDFFRITDPKTLCNQAIRHFLCHLDPTRHVAHRAASPPVRDPFTGLEGRHIDTSTRMRTSRKTILQAIASDVRRS